MNYKLYPVALLLLLSCPSFGQDDSVRVKTAYEYLGYVGERNYERAKASLPVEVAEKVPDAALVYYVDMGSDILKTYEMPNKGQIIRKSVLLTTGPNKGKTVFYLLFPFPPSTDEAMPEKVIEIGFMIEYGDKVVADYKVTSYVPVGSK